MMMMREKERVIRSNSRVVLQVVAMVIVVLGGGIISVGEGAIGVNWGTVSKHKLVATTVVDLLHQNKISKVKLFDADPEVVGALRGTHIQLMLGIPNDFLPLLSSSPSAADLWVHSNLTRYISTKPTVDIRYVAVGNEPFLSAYAGQYVSLVLPALLNLQQSLLKANLASSVKLIVPCNADAYQTSSLPSQGAFRPDLVDVISQLLSFLNSNASPFVVNIYPFLSLYGNPDFPQDYAFFGGTAHPLQDPPNVYYNAFDGNYDTLVAALNNLGYGQMPIIIGEVGWPTDGSPAANLTAARAFNQGLINHLITNKGTPLRPAAPPLDVYLFALLDEPGKSILPGNFERHWGIFSFDGQAKYPLNLGLGNELLKNARNVGYLPPRWCVANPSKDPSTMDNHIKLACTVADCTTLNYGGSCNGIGVKGNISYAFNSYYQVQKQDANSCDFDGVGMVTFLDPSLGQCRFLVGVTDSDTSSSPPSSGRCRWMIIWATILTGGMATLL